MNKIKSVDEIPKLFDTKKYESALLLDAEGWFHNLMLRKTLSEKYITMGIPEDIYDHYEARSSHEVSALSISSLLTSPIQYEKHQPPSGIQYSNCKPYGNGAVFSLSKYQAYNLYFDQAEYQQKQIKNDFTRTYSCDQTEELDEFLVKYAQPIHDDNIILNTERLKLRNPIGHEYPQNQTYACVNLEASDDIIMEDFKKWLLNTKKSYFGNFRDKQFTRSNFLSWCDASVLQYLDLSIWAEIDNIAIPHHIMGEAIYPSNKQVNVAEAVRRTTKPLAEILMSSGLSILNTQRFTEK